MCETGGSGRGSERQQLSAGHQQQAAGGRRSSAGAGHGGGTAGSGRRPDRRELQQPGSDPMIPSCSDDPVISSLDQNFHLDRADALQLETSAS